MASFCSENFLRVLLPEAENASYPVVDPCFEHTVLTWIPCALMIICSPFLFFTFHRNRQPSLPLRPLLLAKIILAFVQTIITASLLVSGLAENQETVLLIHHILLFATTVNNSALTILCYRNGIVNCGAIFVTWALFTLCGWTEIFWWIWRFENGSSIELTHFVHFLLWYSTVLIQFILHSFADEPSNYENLENDNVSPEHSSSFINRHFFLWLNPLIFLGYRKHLEHSDLWDLNKENTTEVNVDSWQKSWDKAGQNPSIVWQIVKLIKWNLLIGAFYKLIASITRFVYPFFLSYFLDFVQNPDQPSWYGLFYACAMFAIGLFESVCYFNYQHWSQKAGVNLTAALTSAIFRKALRLSHLSKTEHSTGQIINHLTVDINRFAEVTAYGHIMWAMSIEIIIGMFMLWHQLGAALLPGILMMILLTIPTFFGTHKVTSYKVEEMRIKDKRLKFLSEVLNGIRVLKFYAWEPSVEKRISDIRDEEMRVHKKVWFVDSGIFSIALATPFLVALSSFGAYVLIDSSHVLTAEKVFVSLVLFNIIRWPLQDIPHVVASVIQAVVSNRRLNQYFAAPELDNDSVDALDHNSANAVVFQNSSFGWDKMSSPTLKSLNFTIPKGSLVAVVGKVGSGKSSLLSAALGEMEKASGYAAANPSIAYVPQQAWIMNLTVRDNVLFGKAMDKRFYKNVIRSCALTTDLDTFPAGDNTEIGEKGINLSGGQKQRVSLARAVYQQKELYLLDDPLSAVDSAVGSEIFENIIGPNGLLKDKTRILVTHSTKFLEFTDKVIVLKDGVVSEIGTYDQLLENNDAFAQFIDEFHTETTTDNQVDTLVVDRQVSTDSMLGDDMAGDATLMSEEHVATGNVGLRVYLSYLNALGIVLALSFILGYAISSGLDATSNAWLAHWSNEAERMVNTSGDTSYYLGIYGSLGMGEVFFSTLASVLVAVSAIRSGKLLHNQLVHNLLTSTIQFFESTPVGRILNVAGKDIDTVDNELPDAFRLAWLNFTIVSTTIIVILFITPWFGAIAPLVALVLFWIFKYYVATSRQVRRLESVSRSPLYAHIEQGIHGAVSIRAYKAQERFILDTHKYTDKLNTCVYPGFVSYQWLAVHLSVVSAGMVFVASLLAVFARNSGISVGSIGLSLNYAMNVLIAMEKLVADSGRTETEIVSVERINQYNRSDKEAAWSVQQSVQHWPSLGRIEFRSFSTRYRDDLDFVLKKISFTILPSEKLGVVGRTGAGKSSLTLSLFRLLEAAEGQILIDGQDISHLGLQQLRSNLTIIPQDPVLFSGTLKQNLDPFNYYDDSDIWNALNHSHLSDFVSNLPMKLEHEVAEGGGNLSVGQRQLLCLSRALLRGSRILILDEATASVDMETDAMIQTTIHTHFKSATIITIAHRINTILNSDRVMVLDDGQVREFDAPTKLLGDTNSLFYEMARNAGVL